MRKIDEPRVERQRIGLVSVRFQRVALEHLTEGLIHLILEQFAPVGEPSI